MFEKKTQLDPGSNIGAEAGEGAGAEATLVGAVEGEAAAATSGGGGAEESATEAGGEAIAAATSAASHMVTHSFYI